MGSTDFSVYSYTHLNVSGDVELKFFDDNLTEDSQHIIPLIQGALSKNPDMKFMLSPWSPPVWMKAADPARNYTPSMLGSAIPNGLVPEYRLPWAKYFSRFMSAYKKRGIKFWGLTPQNEPEFAAPWEACRSTPEFQADFIGDFLGPIIASDHPGTKIMVYDHNRVSAPHWAQVLYSHPKASKYMQGLTSHWYNNNDRYMDGIEFHERNNDTHYVDESRFMLSTETSITPGVVKGDEAWERAQRYAHNIISELNNWVNGWLDWNLIVNHYGGPNHLSFYYDAAIILNEDGKDYTVQPIYYFIQHISKYALPGSRRIDSQVSARFKKPGETKLNVHFSAALHTCDGSSRQSFSLADGKLQVKGSESCLDVVPRPDVGEDQLEVVKCVDATNTWAVAANGAIRTGDVCLQLYKGSHQDGAGVTIAKCLDKLPGYQKWAVKNGLVTSADAPSKCVTAGYGFVQSVAFLTRSNKKVLVVLNENTEDVDFELQYQGSSVATTIPAGAIHTYQWE